jgi:hypothetical protein
MGIARFFNTTQPSPSIESSPDPLQNTHQLETKTTSSLVVVNTIRLSMMEQVDVAIVGAGESYLPSSPSV